MHLITHKVTKATRSVTDDQLASMKDNPFIMNQYTVMAKPEEPEEVTALKNKKNKPKTVETPIENNDETDMSGRDGNETVN